jgi:hypothetical protein
MGATPLADKAFYPGKTASYLFTIKDPSSELIFSKSTADFLITLLIDKVKTRPFSSEM